MTDRFAECLPSKGQQRKVRHRYGVTPKDFIRMLEEQDGRCAICTVRFSKRHRPHVDHCHHTMWVRGLLCNNCNSGLGKLGDNSALLKRAVKYLKESETMNRNAMRGSQPDQVLAYLKSRKHITQATASTVLGCSRLAAIIHRLKKKGHNIEARRINGVKGQYAEYRLVEDEAAAA